MLRWMFSKSVDHDSHLTTQSARDDRTLISDSENFLFIELVVAEVEGIVVEFELKEEKKREAERKLHRKPDYSWLISDRSLRPRKYLSIQEKHRIENACERLKPDEWPKTIENWKKRAENATTREQIIEQFIIATHETIQSRKHEPSISEVFKMYAQGRSNSLRSIHSSDASPSSRSVTQLSIIELQEIV